MRNKRITGFTNCKISNLLVAEGFIGSGQATNSEKIDLVESDSNGSINITVPSGKDLIEFTNVTYSNGSTEYELLNGIVTNAGTGTPSLAIYNGNSNLDMVDLTLGTKVGNNIPIEVTGKNFDAGTPATVYESGVQIDDPEYNFIGIEHVWDDPTKLELNTYYATTSSFVFTDLSDNSIIDIFNGVGVQTIRVRFTLLVNDNLGAYNEKWFFDFGQYERTLVGQLQFGSVNELIKDPEGEAIPKTLSEFLIEINNSAAAYDRVVLENLTFGTTIPPSTFTNVLTYNVF